MKATWKNTDEYISACLPEQQPYLHEMRAFLASCLPHAEEVISYGMPSFKLDKLHIYFAAFKKHLGFYPGSGSTLDKFADELKNYAYSKGGLQIPYTQRLPKTLLKKIIKERQREIKEKNKI